MNAFIFGGSFSIGTMKAGFDLQEVLEISDSQPTQNAFYFIKNVEDVPVVLPSTWENEEYMAQLYKKNIDLMCCNCPCSSLSKINRNASVDGKNNVHFYRLFKMFRQVKPKVFIVENAPTLVSIGLRILQDMVSQLEDKYRFTVIRDFAGNHGVPMLRHRTLVVGWRRDAFPQIPLVEQDCQKKVTVKDTLNDIMSNTVDDFKSPTADKISDLYKYAIPGHTIMQSLAVKMQQNENGFADMLNKRLSGTSYLREINRISQKMTSGKRYWDKSPIKLRDNEHFPSFTSVTQYIHPHQDRMLNVLELKRIMNYPDWYDFTDPEKKCTIPLLQAMAQGVPVNFGKYIALQARKALEKKLELLDSPDTVVVLQNHSSHMRSLFTSDEFKALTELNTKKDAEKIK